MLARALTRRTVLVHPFAAPKGIFLDEDSAEEF